MSSRLGWIALAAALAACGRDVPPRSSTERPASASSRPHPFGDARGPIVTASDLFLDTTPLGIAPGRLTVERASLSERLRKLPTAATLSYTHDAPASAVLAVLRGLFETGHPRVELVTELAGKPTTACSVTAAPADTVALKVELRGDRVELGLSEVRPVLHRELADAGLVARLRDDLAAPFFDRVGGVEIAVDATAAGGELHRVMTALCDKLGAWRVGDLAAIQRARHQPATLPLCRNVIVRSPASGHDPEQLRAALPELDAMDLCYRRFARAPGPVGTVTMTLEIKPDGTVGDHAAAGLDPEVNRCIAWLVGRGRLPHPTPTSVRMRATAECNTRCCNGD